MNSAEPKCIKIYEGMTNKINNVTLIMLSLMSDADSTDEYGGMIVTMNAFNKMKISKECNISISRINHTLTILLNDNMIRRIIPTVYQFNPYKVGKGKWNNILRTREIWNQSVS